MNNDTVKNYEKLTFLLELFTLSNNEILDLFTNYQGMQILTDDFIQFVCDEIGADYDNI